MSLTTTPADCRNERFAGCRLERPLLRAAQALVDLPDRAEMVGQMRDAGGYPGQLDRADRAQRFQYCQPTMRFVSKPTADRGPRRAVHRGSLPRLVPSGISEWI